MGLGGISIWQLILILLIAVFALLAVPLPHRADAPVAEEGEQTASSEAADEDDSDEEPPLGVG